MRYLKIDICNTVDGLDLYLGVEKKQNPCLLLGSWVNYGFIGEMGAK